MLKKIYFILFVFTIFAACNSNSNNNSGNETPPPPVATNTPTQNIAMLPKLPKAEADNLWNNCTYVDLVFYNLPFSMSIDNQPGIRSNLIMIANKQISQNPACKSIGRVIYQIDGAIVLEADMFYGEGCNYFVFYKDKKAVYANSMTAEGIQYFTNVMTQVKVK
ncbi:MAG TPA: hypothetical protein ENI82_01655 [Bacteroidetes bacterium]|nr:hypothetical protein [Bacteroidota bacterium]